MAKKLIKKITEKFRKMNETENKDVNTEPTQENPQAEHAEGTDNTAATTDNITENTDSNAQADWEAKYNEVNDKYLRLYSEFDNYRRRVTRERSELISGAGADMLKAMLPVVDDFERGLKNMEKATDVLALREGVELIYNKLKSTLQNKGLEEMRAVGQVFDADIHEAITQIPVPDEDMKGKVVDEVEKGYYLNGKVIRYAKVVVGS